MITDDQYENTCKNLDIFELLILLPFLVWLPFSYQSVMADVGWLFPCG